MRVNEAKLEFELMFLERGMSLDALDLWESWKIFSAFLRRPVDCDHDTASVQAQRGTGFNGQTRFYLSMIRQLSTFENGCPIPFRHIVVELAYDPRVFGPAADWSVWTDDFSTFGDFASAVQSRAEFEKALNMAVLSSELFEVEC